MCFSKCHLALASVASMSISLDYLNNFGMGLTRCICLSLAYPFLLYVLSSSQPCQTFFDMVLFLLDKLKWDCKHCGHTFHFQTFVKQHKLCLSLTNSQQRRLYWCLLPGQWNSPAVFLAACLISSYTCSILTTLPICFIDRSFVLCFL